MAAPTDVTAIRIGVTGTRALSNASRTAIRPHIEEALAAAKAAVERNANNEDYLLRIISPLAEGADQFVANIALQFGYDLSVIMPFAREEYESDFENFSSEGEKNTIRVDEFRELLSKSSQVLELDGNREAEAASYEAAGRVVARNSDLLIAVWNGKEGAGRGGTADIVRFAVEQGVPVWWVPVDGSPPGWITSLQHTIKPKSAPSGSRALEHLEAHLTDLFRVDGEAEVHAHGFFGWISHLLHHGGQDHEGRQGPVKRWWFGAYAHFERALSSKAPKESYPAAVTSGDGSWLFWQSKSASADRDAQVYMAGYRSSYVIVLLFAALALMLAVASLAWPKAKIIFSVIEFALLAGIGGIVFLNQREGWHGQAMRSRLSAELCRTQAFLSLFADSVPISAATATQQEIRWFLRLRRAAPMMTGHISHERLNAIRSLVRVEMFENQRIYHKNRKNKMSLSSRRLAYLGEALFIFILSIVSLKILLIFFGFGYAFIFFIGVLSAALPAVAAFSVGIRSYAEFDLLAEQSKRMEAVMSSALHRLERVEADTATASQRMADIVRDAAEDMLQELQGWSTVARSKGLEAG